MTGILKVTNGTDSVSFLGTSAGVILDEWQPQTHQAKDGGVWTASAFTDGRQMVMRQWANNIETFGVNVVGGDMDGIVASFRKLEKLLTDAGQYWIDDYQISDAARPVWIEARGDCETETRYAYIYDGTIPMLSNPHKFPFRGTSTETIDVIIEHGVWRDSAPGDTECLQTYSYRLDDGAESGIFYPSSDADTITLDTGAASLTTNQQQANDGGSVFFATRFGGINIPQGATILSAYMVYRSTTAKPIGELIYSTVYGEDNDNSAAFTTYANFMARPTTTATCALGIDWGKSTNPGDVWTWWENSLIDVIQEIVDRPAWAENNSLSLSMSNPGCLICAGDLRDYAPNTHATYAKPELHIAWLVSDVEFGVSTPTCEDSYAVSYDVKNQPDWLVYYDASTGIYTPNLIGTQPTTLFPQPLGVGDRLMIGSDYPLANHVFNLGTAGDGTVTLAMRYSTAGGVFAGTNTWTDHPFALYSGLGNAGFKSSVFRRRSTHAANSIVLGPLPNKYWITYEVTAIPVAPTTAPTQVDKAVYSVQWPYWEVAASEVGGDIDALTKFLLAQIETDDTIVLKGAYTHFILGTRHYNRGGNFTPYLNTQANDAFISFSGTTVANPLAPSGQAIDYVTAGVSAEAQVGSWRIDGTSYTSQWRGHYRAFVRIYQNSGNAGEAGFRVRFTAGWNGIYPTLDETDIEYTTISGVGYDLIDLGYISTQSQNQFNPERMLIYLRALATAAVDIHVLDIILFPVDESTVEVQTNDEGEFEYYFSGDPAPGWQPKYDGTLPKEGNHSAVINSSDAIIYTTTTKTLGFTIPPEDRMRIYMLMWNDGDGDLKGTEAIVDGRFERVLQFKNMRGDS